MATETLTQRKRRLEKAKQKYREKGNTETNSQRVIRLAKQRDANKQRRERETSKHHAERLNDRRIQDTTTFLDSCYEDFEAEVSVFPEKVCDICTKKCYPKQVANILVPPDWLPPELISKVTLTLCHRCKSYLTSKKTNPPPKAYWNNLHPGIIPPEIQVLTQAEQRLLARIHPFLKIIKFSGLYGQYGLRGQAILFALDIFEVIEKIPTLLPRSTADADIIVIMERLQNVDSTRDYTVSRSKLNAALQWLKSNNPLYKDVVIDENAHLDERDLIRSSLPDSNEDGTEDEEIVSEYTYIYRQQCTYHSCILASRKFCK